MFIKCYLLLTSVMFVSYSLHSQDMKPFTPTGEATYYDFWEGTWLGLREDGTLDSTLQFIVKRGVHSAAFKEYWTMGEGNHSFALRAWDKINSKWGFTWISQNGLYQVWDSEKMDGHWYIIKEFTINNERYLSRQAFIPQADGTVVRISEKSYDRKHWELRFRQVLKKVS